MWRWLGSAVTWSALAVAQQPAAALRPADCALLVVSTGLAKFGAGDLHLLYEFAQKAGAELPKTGLKDCYAEIAQLGDDGGTAAGIAAALSRLASKYQAVDLIVHTHGKPFLMVCADGPVDMVEFAVAGNAALAAQAQAARSHQGVDVALRQGGRFLAAEGGGGTGLTTCGSQGLGAARFRLLPRTGTAVGAGVQVLVATRTGHYLRLVDGVVRADAAAAAAMTFAVECADKVLANKKKLHLRAPDGRGLALDASGKWHLAAGAGDELEVRLLPPPAAPTLTPLPAAASAHLRCALSTACYGATHAPAFCNLGFRAAAGSRGVSADSATSFPTFLHYWGRGYTFAEAVQFANGADALRVQDRLAAGRFHGVDSIRVVAGDGDLDCLTTAR